MYSLSKQRNRDFFLIIRIATGRGHQYAERIVDIGILEIINEFYAENTIRGLALLLKKR